MPTFTKTIQEFSPLLQYSGQWGAGTGSSDTFISSYSQGGFVATQSIGASVTFTFNGTAVQIFGAKRPNHGLYQVTVDGTQSPAVSGSSDSNSFQTPIFTANSLPPGQHTVTLANSEDKFVDIDYVSWQNSIGQLGEDMIVNTVDDTSSDFSYSPPSAWTKSAAQVDTFLASTGHQTSVPGSFFEYTFTGPSVSLFGPIGPSYSPYTVQIDDGTIVNYSAKNDNFIPQVMLFYADNLSSGQHTVKVSYQPSQDGQLFAVDYASTSSTQSLGGIPLSAAPKAGVSGGTVAGIFFGILIPLALLFAGLFYLFIWRRRRRANSAVREKIDIDASGVEVYSANKYLALPGRTYSVRQPVQDSYMTSRNTPPHNRTYSNGPTSVYSGVDEANSPTSYDSHEELIRSGSSSSNSTSPRGSSAAQFSAKGRRLHLPPAAGQSLSEVSHDELAASRMVVEGRPQDFGAVNAKDYVPTVEDRRELNPPPNYLQATETY
jgi:hypothetical protein